MTNEEYLENEGLHLFDHALVSYYDGKCRGDVAHGLYSWLRKREGSLSDEEKKYIDRFILEYIVLRLYVCSCMVRDFHAGLGASRPLLSGIKELLSDLPMHMKVKSMESRLSGGCFLLSGCWARYTKTYLRRRFETFAAIEASHMDDLPKEEALRHTIEESLENSAALIGMELSLALRSYFLAETEAYIRNLSERLSDMTPQAIYKKAKSRTLYDRANALTMETAERAWPSLMTVASMMCGLLYMLA